MRAEILGYIAEMKRAAGTVPQRQLLDEIAIHLITQDCRPQVMVHGLQQWLGLTQPLAESDG